MKTLIAIIAAAVISVLAMLAMHALGSPSTDDSVLRPAIAGAVAGITALIASSRKPKK